MIEAAIKKIETALATADKKTEEKGKPVTFSTKAVREMLSDIRRARRAEINALVGQVKSNSKADIPCCRWADMNEVLKVLDVKELDKYGNYRI